MFDPETGLVKFRNVVWFTNLDHGRRHEPLALMTQADNLKFSRRKEIKSAGYQKYDNYEAIEVPFTEAIPSDYDGVMGVPITFLNKHNPQQFKLIGLSGNGLIPRELLVPGFEKYDRPYLGGKRMYARLLIQRKQISK